MRHLTGTSAVVTGARGDIGRGIAEALMAEGASVVGVDLPATQSGRPFSAGVIGHECDVTDSDAMATVFRTAQGLDVVFANAGIVRSSPFLDITREEWDEHLHCNLTGVFVTLQEAAREMRRRDRPGHVVITGSWVGAVPWPEIAAYSATKAAVAMLARSAARELASHGIRVNVLSPGIVRAGLAKHQLETEPPYAARVATVIPLERLQEVEEVTAAAVFLAGEGARYMTGSELLVDGGCSLFKFD